MNFAYQKQILFALTFGIFILIGFHEHENSTVNYKRGLLAAILLFIVQGSLIQYHGSFTKRFEGLWRAASRVTIVYLLLLVFIFYQTADDARQLLTHLDPELGKPIRWGCLDDSCHWTWRDVYDSLDTFYLRNLAGWFFTTLIVRDKYALYFASFLIEVFDFSWEYIYMVLDTCLWYRVIVEMILTYALGIALGMFVIRKTGLREFDWFGRKGKKNVKDWGVFHNHRRFGGVYVLFVILIANYFCSILIMKALWIRFRHIFNVYKLVIWLFLEALSIGELYDDVETWGTETRRQTPISNEYRWVAYGIIVLESVIIWKFRHRADYYQYLEISLVVSKPWNVICMIIVVAAAVYYLYLRLQRNRMMEYGDSAWEIEARMKEKSEPICSSPEKEQVIEEEDDKKTASRRGRLSKKYKEEEELDEPEMTELRKIQEQEEEDSSEEELSSSSSEEEWGDGVFRSPLRFKL